MRLEGLLAVLAGADPVGLLDRHDEHLAVADRSCAGVLEDRLDHDLDVAGGDDALELDLRPQPVGQRRAAVALGDALLAPGALDLGDRERREAELEQVVADRLERLVTDERLHLLHVLETNAAAAARGSGRPSGRGRAARGPRSAPGRARSAPSRARAGRRSCGGARTA